MSRRRRSSVHLRLFGVGTTLAGVALAVVASAFPAAASLGGDTVSIVADQMAMQGSRKATTVNSYTVHEIQAVNNTVVREYQASDGTVFGVAWHGPFTPDLRQVLGSYYPQFTQAMHQRRAAAHVARGPVTITQPGFTVQLGGHMRSFTGKAYVPEKLPEGMHAEDIQ